MAAYHKCREPSRNGGKRMTQQPTYSYDKEADVLYISFAPGEKATAAVELNDNILLRFNRAEKRAVGLTLMDFSVLVQVTNFGPRSFPLTGLKELEAEWQETVIEMGAFHFSYKMVR